MMAERFSVLEFLKIVQTTGDAPISPYVIGIEI